VSASSPRFPSSDWLVVPRGSTRFRVFGNRPRAAGGVRILEPVRILSRSSTQLQERQEPRLNFRSDRN
jgi:hypothetical protein